MRGNGRKERVSDSDEHGASGSRLAIVVVNYASTALVRAHLVPLSAPRAQVVLVDSFSSDQERAAARALAEQQRWAFVAMTGNPGFGAGVNAGVRAAAELGCDVFLLLNPDAVVTAATVHELHVHSQQDHLALISPRLVDPDGRLNFAGSRLSWRDGRIRGLRGRSRPVASAPPDLEWLTAACLVVHSDVWDRVGGFDESYFMYWEDVDFNVRCLAGGAHVVLRDDLVAVHDQGGTQGLRRGRAKSGLYYYYNCRNRGLFAARHLFRRDLLRWLLFTPAVTYEVYLQGGRRQLLESPALLRFALAGGVAASVHLMRALLRRSQHAGAGYRARRPRAPA